MPNRRHEGEAALLVVIVLPHVLRVLPVVPVVVHVAAGFGSLWIELPLAGPAGDGCDGEAEGAEVAAAVQASNTSAQLLRGFWSIKTPEQNTRPKHVLVVVNRSIKTIDHQNARQWTARGWRGAADLR